MDVLLKSNDRIRRRDLRTRDEGDQQPFEQGVARRNLRKAQRVFGWANDTSFIPRPAGTKLQDQSFCSFCPDAIKKAVAAQKELAAADGGRPVKDARIGFDTVVRELPKLRLRLR